MVAYGDICSLFYSSCRTYFARDFFSHNIFNLQNKSPKEFKVASWITFLATRLFPIRIIGGNSQVKVYLLSPQTKHPAIFCG